MHDHCVYKKRKSSSAYYKPFLQASNYSISVPTDYIVPNGHYCDVIMGTVASQITSRMIVYTAVYSDADQSKHQSSASLAFVWGIHRGPVNSPHKWPVTRKMFPFDDVIMYWVISKHNDDCTIMQVFYELFGIWWFRFTFLSLWGHSKWPKNYRDIAWHFECSDLGNAPCQSTGDYIALCEAF